jgi:hypothetical protein
MSVVGIHSYGPIRWARRLLLNGIVVVGAGGAGVLIVNHPDRLRLAIAALVLGTLLLLALLRPTHAIVALLAFLAFMGLIRRLLIPIAGWSTHDPLLLIGPILAGFLFVDLFLRQNRSLASDRLSRFMLALLGLTLVEAFNPLSGSLVAGLGGLLFAAVPLLWFFIGRELATRQMLATIFGLTVVFGVAIAGYGLYQTKYGLPSWDRDWVSIAGYAALRVGKATRAFGTMASSAEYAYYLAAAIVIALTAALHRRIFALAALPLLGWALYLESSRGIIVLAVLSVLVLIGLRSGGRKGVVVAVAAGVALAAYGLRGTAPVPTGPVIASDALQTHLVGGLQHPLSSKSDLPSKFHASVAGVKLGFTHPFGYGTASSNIAGEKFGGTTVGGEEDLPNAFSSLGLLGGFLFIAIVVLALGRAVRLYLRELDFVSGAAFGVLIVTLDQWLNGGYYSVAPLLWLTIGWIWREEALAVRPGAR